MNLTVVAITFTWNHAVFVFLWLVYWLINYFSCGFCIRFLFFCLELGWCWPHKMSLEVSSPLLFWKNLRKFGIQFSSVAQLCPTLCKPVNHSTPGLPVHHQLPESTQTHVHWVGDPIQPCHLLSSPSPPALNLSQHQGLFKWVSSSYQVALVFLKYFIVKVQRK